MTPKVKTYPNGWSASLYEVEPWYCASVRTASGQTYDAVRCDSASEARAYFRMFDKIARKGGPG